MSDDLQARLARRSTVRRALAFAAMSAVIVLAVAGRWLTEPAPRSALGAAGLANPVGAVPSGAVPPGAPATSAAPPRRSVHPTPRSPHRTKPRVTSTSARTSAVPKTTRRPVAPTTAPAPKTTTAPATTVARTITGSAYDVSYGLVQVKVIFRGSRIVDVTSVSLPHGGRSSDISAMAAPQLRREALAAQSASINAVSGASYTSAGYAKSLQSAIDRSGQ